MKGDDGEERGRRYEDEAREAEYGDYTRKRQAQFRRAVLIFFIAIVVILVVSFLMSKR
jgi:predicted nucleic acid-binding Zn ribbon protein